MEWTVGASASSEIGATIGLTDGVSWVTIKGPSSPMADALETTVQAFLNGLERIELTQTERDPMLPLNPPYCVCDPSETRLPHDTNCGRCGCPFDPTPHEAPAHIRLKEWRDEAGGPVVGSSEEGIEYVRADLVVEVTREPEPEVLPRGTLVKLFALGQARDAVIDESTTRITGRLEYSVLLLPLVLRSNHVSWFDADDVNVTSTKPDDTKLGLEALTQYETQLAKDQAAGSPELL